MELGHVGHPLRVSSIPTRRVRVHLVGCIKPEVPQLCSGDAIFLRDKSPTGETQLLLLSPRPAAVGHGVGTAQSVGPRLGRRHPSTCGEVTPGGSKRPPRGERWPRSSPAPLQQRVVPHAITQELAALGSNSLLPDMEV